MRNHLLFLLVLAVALHSEAAGGAHVSAQAGALSFDSSHPVGTAPPERPASTTLSLRGTIDKYDASTRILSMSTEDGPTRMVVASNVRIRRGWHRLDASALEKLSGYGVTVRYSETGGSKTLESIHVFDRDERTKR